MSGQKVQYVRGNRRQGIVDDIQLTDRFLTILLGYQSSSALWAPYVFMLYQVNLRS